MRVEFIFMDSIDPIKRRFTVEVPPGGVTEQFVCDSLKRDLERRSRSATDTGFKCEFLVPIYDGEWAFVVHSADMVFCKEVGFIFALKEGA